MPTAINTARRLSCFGCASFREGELSPVASPRRRARSLSDSSYNSSSVSNLKSVINVQTGWNSPAGSRCATPSKDFSQSVDRFRRFQTLRCLNAQVDIFPAKADTSWLRSWNFDALSVSDEENFSHVLNLFDDLGLLSPSLVEPEALRNLLDLLALHYKDNPYHNFQHAADITHTVYRLIGACSPTIVLNKHERLALMLAALAHDVQHPGQSNLFLVQTANPVAVRFNNKAVLENLHVAALFELLSEHPEADVLRNLQEQDALVVRDMVSQAILHTDMAEHFNMVSKVDKIIGEGHKSKPSISLLDRQELLNLILHASDVSNPCKPWEIAEQWSKRVFLEFFIQGDLERSLGLPVSPNMDRATTSRLQAQLKFIEMIVAPLFANVVHLLPGTTGLFQMLLHNYQQWVKLFKKELIADPNKEENMKRDELGTLKLQQEAFVKKYLALI